ncbi:hypothetical protein GCM10009119_01970 [Algoriphagus jejuensis]|uniref:NB-ARC domain-containing protein n=1 Tax=Algoriphagus jejuensis TaxID=419934 RepID=A0ABN1MV20_9BACT
MNQGMKHVFNAAKIGLSLGSFFLPGYLNPENPLIAEIIKGLSTTFLGNILNQYDPVELLKSLDKNNTNQNHDIGKLMTASVPRAVRLVSTKFQQEHNCDKATKKFLDELVERAEVSGWQFEDDASFLADKNEWIDEIQTYVFGRQQNVAKETIERVDPYFKDNLPACYELVFTEGLKNKEDEKPLKAFLIKTLTGLEDQLKGQTKLSEQILEEVRLLKEDMPCRSLGIAQDYFKEEFERVHAKLDRILDDLEELKKGQGELRKGQEEILEVLQRPGKIEIARHLSEPPFVTETFLGREAELESIWNKFHSASHALVLVNGDGGVGKTSIASTYYHKHAGYYRHLAWVYSEKNIGNALLSLATGLQVEFEEQEQIKERLAKILTALANLEPPVLLVIDNANEVEDLDKYYLALKRLPGLHLLLTSRLRNFQQAEMLPIEGLPDEQAIELFTKYYKKHKPDEDPLLLAIYEAVGRNTLG